MARSSEMRQYDEQYDAWYDPRNGKWLERDCGDPNCGICANRPPKKKLPWREKLMARLIARGEKLK